MTGLSLVADTLVGSSIAGSQDLLLGNIGYIVIFALSIFLVVFVIVAVRGAFGSASGGKKAIRG